MPAVRSVVLASDWNGTLVDDADRLWEATNVVIRARGGLSISRAQFLDRFCLPLERFLGQWGLAGPELVSALWEWNFEVGSRLPIAMDGLLEMSRALRTMGIRFGIISAADERVVLSDMEQVGLTDQVDFVLAGVRSKRAAIAAIHSDGILLCYIGDTEYDVTEALAAGAVAIGFGSGYRPATALKAAGANHVVASLRSVPRLIEAISATEGSLGKGRQRGSGPRKPGRLQTTK